MEITNFYSNTKSSPSFFSHSENNFFSVSFNSELSATIKKQFSNLVENRNTCLTNLTNIGNNWASGKSLAPKKEALDAGKQFLNTLANYINRTNAIVPKLLMGPIPSGGISIEVHTNATNAIYVSIMNDETIDVEIKKFDYFYTIPANKKNIALLVEKYEQLTER